MHPDTKLRSRSITVNRHQPANIQCFGLVYFSHLLQLRVMHHARTDGWCVGYPSLGSAIPVLIAHCEVTPLAYTIIHSVSVSVHTTGELNCQKALKHSQHAAASWAFHAQSPADEHLQRVSKSLPTPTAVSDQVTGRPMSLAPALC